MSDPTAPHVQLPPIPEGCGILPIAENFIVHGPDSGQVSPGHSAHPGSAPVAVAEAAPNCGAEACQHEAQPGADDSTFPIDPDSVPQVELNDSLEQTYRRVLARALALAGGALLFTATVAASLAGNSAQAHSLVVGELAFRVILVTQILFLGYCSRYMEKLSMTPAAILLFSYAGFCALEFSALLPPRALAAGFLCAALMYAAAAFWGYYRHFDLARPITPLVMILGGSMAVVGVNMALGSASLGWSLSALAVVVFALLEGSHAQQIRDFYQEFDDDNAQGWKASVLGALLLLINSVNVYLLVATFLGRFAEENSERSRRSGSSDF